MKCIPRAWPHWLLTLGVAAGLGPAFQAGAAGCVSAPTGLVAWWPGDGNGDDVVGGNRGTLQGGATASAAGMVGPAFSFDGTNSYVQVADAPALKPTNLTVEAWVQFSALDSAGNAGVGQQYILFKQNSRTSNFEGYDLGKARIGGLDLFVFEVTSSSGQLASVFSTTVVTTGVWYHVAGVRGSNFLQLYVNGQLQSQTNVNFPQDYGTRPLYLGSSGQAYWDRKFAGTLDEVTLYNRALTPSEVMAIYLASAAGKCKAPSVVVQPQSLGVVAGSSVEFTVGAKGLGSLSYQWRHNGGNLVGATGASLILSNVQPVNAGSYSVVVTNTLGAVTSQLATLTVWMPPVITAQPQSRTNVVGTEASFSVGVSGTEPLSYQWELNGAALAGTTGSSLVRSGVTFGDGGNYRVVVMNLGGTVTSAVAVLTVVCPAITVAPSTLRSGMVGNSYSQTLTAGGGWGPYRFAVTAGALPPGLNLSSAGVLAGIPTALGTNNFTVTAWDTNACSGSQVCSLAVTATPPVITLQPLSHTNLATTAATFTAAAVGTAPLNYQWRFNGVALTDTELISGAGSTALAFAVVQPPDAGSYTLVVSNAAGVVTSATATLTVLAPPAIHAQPVSRSVSAGANAVFGVTASGTAPLSYQWQFNQVNIAGASGANFILSQIQPTNAGSYRVVVTNVVGSVTSAVASLTVTAPPPPPSITTQPASLASVVGSEASFSVTASGSPPLSYQWRFNGGVIPGATSTRLTLSDIQPTVVGSYTVVVTNLGGAATSAVAVLTLLVPPMITAQPVSASVAAGADINFSVTASGAQPMNYQWLLNGTVLWDGGQFSGATATNLLLSNVQPANAGSYSVVVANAAGATTSAVAVLNVSLPASCVSVGHGLTGWWPGDGSANDLIGTNHGTLRDGATAGGAGMVGSAFSFDGINDYVAIADAPALKPANLTVEAWVRFSSLDSAGNAAAGQQYIVFEQNSRTYGFEGYDLGKSRVGGQDLFAFRASSAGGILAEVLSTTVVTTGVWYHVAGVRGPTTIQLYVNGQLERQATVSFAQDYGTTPLYLGSSGQAYWDRKFAGTLDEVTLYSRALSSNEVAGIYAAGGRGKCKEAGIVVQPQSQGVVAGSNAVFTAGATGFGALGYQWRYNGVSITGATNTSLALSNVQPGNEGSYTVVVTNQLGSATSAVATLTVWVPPAITLQPQSRTNLLGTDAAFSVTASGTPPPRYQWQFNGTPLPGATGSVLLRSAASFAYIGAYRVILSHPAGVITSAVATLTVTGAPPLITLQPQARTNAAGTKATFTSSATGTTPLNYRWHFNGAALSDSETISGATSSTLELAVVQPGDAGSYALVVSNVAGVVTSATATLTVKVPPAINISPVSRSVPEGTNVMFSVTASGTLPLSYQWQCNGTNVSGATGPTLLLNGVQATNAGSYTVIVTNTAGSVTSEVAVLTLVVSVEITSQPASQLVVAGMNVAFQVSASGSGPLSYQWRLNGTNLSDGGAYGGATTATLSISNAQPAHAGGYVIVVTSAGRSVTSEVATLEVVLPASCVPAATGLVSWWPGEGNAEDAIGQNDGYLRGGATVNAAGMVGSAFGLDGATGYVEVLDSPELRPTNLTLEVWVRFDSLDSPAVGNSPAGEQFIVFKEGVHLEYWSGYALTKVRNGGGDVFCLEVDSTAGQVAEVRSQTLVQTGAWYHVAGVRGSNYVQLYVNGQLESQINVSFPQSYGNYPLYFGSSGQPAWDHKLAGTLDEVSLYNRPLTSSEIAANYAAGAEGKCRGVAITTQPQSHAAAVGSNVAFSVAASGSRPLMYQWQRNGVNLTNGGNIAGASFPVLSLANVSLGDSASYRVIVTNLLGALTSVVAVLHVSPALTPPSITSQPVGQAVAAGMHASFTVAANGSAPLGYQWRFNGLSLADDAEFSGTTTPTLTISYVLPADSGTYSVVVTNDIGAVTSAVAVLTVSVPTECLTPPPGLVGWWPGDGNARDLVGANNGTFQGGAAADVLAVVGAGFSLDGTNKYIQIPDSPVLRPAELTVECWVKWNNLNTPGTSVYPGQQYIVFKQNSRMADFEGYVLSKDRTWDDIILWEVTSASGQLVRIDSTSPVTTNVWYHLAGVRGSNYIAIYFNGRLEAQANVNFPQDYGNWPLYFGTSGQSYYDRKLNGVIDEVSLYNRALSAGEIAILYASGAAGKCKGTNGLLITAQPQSQVVSSGSDASFSVSAVGTDPLVYQWQFNSAPIPGATNFTLTLPVVQPTNAGCYRAVVANPTGTKTSAEAFLTVAAGPLLLNPRTAAGGAFACTLSGISGQVYVIEVATNFQQWAALTTLTNPTGQADFTDPASSNTWSRFYRARVAD